jgi:MFS family permease
MFLISLGVFVVASALGGFANDGTLLIATRFVKGVSAAFTAPAGLSIITTSFAEGPARNKAISIYTATGATGFSLGLVFGGLLTEIGWRWVFFLPVPIALVTLIAATRLVPAELRVAARSRAFDLAGAVSVTAGLIVLVYAIVKAQAFGWGSARTLGLGAVALALLTAFLAIERRSPAPLVRLSIFRNRAISVANGVFLIVAGGLFGMFFFASLYVQEILGYSPLSAGLAFLPVTGGIVVGAGTAQQLVKRIGVRANAVVGMAIASVGLFLLSGAPVDGTYAANLLPGLLVMSIGMGNTFVPLTLIATTGVEADDAGLASGLFNTAQQVGGALGLAVLSTLAADKTANVLGALGHAPTPPERASALVDGFTVAFTAAAVLVGAGAVLVGVLLRRRDVAAVNPEAAMAPAG